VKVATANVTVNRSDLSRVFAIENSAGPANAPIYEGLWRAGAISEDQGAVNLVRMPSPDQRGKFVVIDKFTGEPGNPQLEIMALMTLDLSDLMRIAHKRCDMDLQIHIGDCGNPQDYKEGWQKIIVLEKARPTNYGTEPLGAMTGDETARVTETSQFEGETLYEIKRLSVQEVARAEVLREIAGITVCDSPSCGACGIPSDGCSVVFAVMKSGAGSPGILAEIIYTKDSGATWAASTVTTLAANETPTGVACIGLNTVVISAIGLALHYADSSDMLNNLAPTWTKVTTGFSASGGPRAIFSANPSYTWIVGVGGYIYFTDDPTNGVTVQDSGSATSQDLNAVSGIDINNLIAVGNSNAVVVTRNGGHSWQAVTGPAVGVNLTSVVMRSKTEWIVGTAGGRIYYTRDSGYSWTQKSFPGNGTGTVTSLAFASHSVGYMTHTNSAPAGRVLRTINGGYSWAVMPEGNASLPANNGMNSVAVCADVNAFYAGGLSSGGTDGIIVKGA
jgi:photosystem II stability/assembly factor-like uncharacterized protein